MSSKLTPERIAEIEWYKQRRIANIHEWGITRRVPCPTCDAPVGEDCHTTSWYPHPQGHAARRRLARA